MWVLRRRPENRIDDWDGATYRRTVVMDGVAVGLDVATGSFRARVRDDPVIGPSAVRFRGVRAPRFPTMFECLVNAIACQQLTLQVGILLLGRLAARHGRRGPGSVRSTSRRSPRVTTTPR